MLTELKPCPFCGGAAVLVQEGTRRQSCIIECESCGASLGTGETGAACGNAWNRRAARAAPVKNGACSHTWEALEGQHKECIHCGEVRTDDAVPAEGREIDGYGDTDFGYTLFGIELEEGDKRLMAMLVRALGTDHPAIDDMTALLFRSRATAPTEPAEGREALAWRVEWERGGQTWVRTYTNERDAIDDGQAFSGMVTPLYRLATAPTMSEAEVLRAERDHARDLSARSIAILSRIRSFLTPEDVRLPDGRVMRFNNPEIEREMLRGLCAAIRAIPGDLATGPAMSEADQRMRPLLKECSDLLRVIAEGSAEEDLRKRIDAEIERIDRAAAKGGSDEQK
jgi:Lar family restriction alleviation protein